MLSLVSRQFRGGRRAFLRAGTLGLAGLSLETMLGDDRLWETHRRSRTAA